jgi:hypothetical protein
VKYLPVFGKGILNSEFKRIKIADGQGADLKPFSRTYLPSSLAFKPEPLFPQKAGRLAILCRAAFFRFLQKRK